MQFFGFLRITLKEHLHFISSKGNKALSKVATAPANVMQPSLERFFFFSLLSNYRRLYLVKLQIKVVCYKPLKSHFAKMKTYFKCFGELLRLLNA